MDSEMELTILQQHALNILSEEKNNFGKRTRPHKAKGETAFKVSAIVSTYNSEQFIYGCLTDLIHQTLYQQGDLEIIVVNSGSEQGEEAIIREFQSRYANIRYIHVEKRETIYAAWNRGIGVAKGTFITNANADDRHRSDALERLAQILDSRPDIALVYADCAVTERGNETFESAQPIGHFRWPDFDRTLLFKVCFIGPQPMWRRDLHQRYGYFDPEFRSAGDYEFWLRVAAHEQFLHIPDVLGLYLLSRHGVERGNSNLSFQESEIARERYWPENSGKRPVAHGSFLVPVTTPRTSALVTREPLHSLKGPQREGQPLVSVIVPTYNRPDKLVDALRSILNQTYSTFEVIVVNDGGAPVDGLISFLDSNHQITSIRHGQNRDRSASRNSALKLARGKYVAYLDDDDIFYPDHLGTLVDFLENTGHEVAYCDAYRVHQSKESGRDVITAKDQPYSHDFDPDDILVSNFIPTLCLMHRRGCLDEVGLFDETLSTHEDWDLWIRLSRKYRFYHIKRLTCEFSWRTDGTSTTSQKPVDFLRTMQIIYERYRDYAKDKPQVIKAQEVNWKTLHDRIPQSELIALREMPLDRGQAACVSKLSGPRHAAVAAVIERVKRYANLGKLELARKIVKKELGDLPECSEVLRTLNDLAVPHLAATPSAPQ